MSYGPPGYPQQPMGYPAPNYPTSDPRSPGRRAAILMWVAGAIGVVFMGLFMLAGMLPLEEYPEPSREQILRSASEAGLDPQVLLRGLAVLGGIGVFVALLMIVLAFFVWRSNRAAVGTTLVINGLLIGLGVLGLLNSVGGGGAGMAVNVCVVGLYIAVLALLFLWLIAAWRNAPLVSQYNLQAAGGYAAGYLYGQQQYPPQYQQPTYPQYPNPPQQYGGYPPPPPPPPSNRPNDRGQ